MSVIDVRGGLYQRAGRWMGRGRGEAVSRGTLEGLHQLTRDSETHCYVSHSRILTEGSQLLVSGRNRQVQKLWLVSWSVSEAGIVSQAVSQLHSQVNQSVSRGNRQGSSCQSVGQSVSNEGSQLVSYTLSKSVIQSVEGTGREGLVNQMVSQ